MSQSLSVSPYSLQLPAGYSLPAGTSTSGSGTSPSSSASAAGDVVSISSSYDAGSFTAASGDVFNLSGLFQAQVGTASGATGYQVALGDGGGQLLLDGVAVTNQTSFTAAQFSQLTYVAGPNGDQQSIVVAAQTGTQLASGALIDQVDSPAVQLTANVTGTVSLNAAAALASNPGGADASTVSLAQSAAIFSGLTGTARPTLAAQGNFTAVAGDTYQLSSLFQASAPNGSSIAGYRVALGAGGGELLLNGAAVTGQTSFTAAQFADLTYVAGPNGDQQSLTVAAQTGTLLASGAITGEVDSQPVQISASVTGARSLNADTALVTNPSGTDTATASLVQSADIFSGLTGSTRPTVTTQGNFTAAVGDVYNVASLFSASAANGGSIAGYRVALGAGGGELLLNGVAVANQTSFTAAQFAQLTYVAGPNGDQQTLTVAAQTGTLLPSGAITGEVDSQPVQISASVTGTRSINVAGALVGNPSGADASTTALAQSADIFSGLTGTTRPTLATQGNFTAVAGDVYTLSSLFKATAPAGNSIAGYRVALGDGGGELLLNGVAVTNQTSFTAAQFAELTYVAGPNGDQQSLTVAAQTGTLLASGAIVGEVDSQAEQIAASVTGTRSLNATAALASNPSGTDTATASLVQSADIFSGLTGTARPTLATVGNITAASGDVYNVDSLFKATAPAGTSIVGYRVALGAGGGQLLLNGVAVTSQTSFTAAQFSQLTYVAGPNGDQQSLTIAAQTGTLLASGAITGEVDSQATQISTSVTGERSINAEGALASNPSGTDTAVAAVVQSADIFSGLIGTTRPTLKTIATAEPSADLATLAAATGAFASSSNASAASSTNLAAFDPTDVGEFDLARRVHEPRRIACHSTGAAGRNRCRCVRDRGRVYRAGGGHHSIRDGAEAVSVPEPRHAALERICSTGYVKVAATWSLSVAPGRSRLTSTGGNAASPFVQRWRSAGSASWKPSVRQSASQSSLVSKPACASSMRRRATPRRRWSCSSPVIDGIMLRDTIRRSVAGFGRRKLQTVPLMAFGSTRTPSANR